MGFSQNNEDQIISDYFGSNKPTCLSLGENNGVHLSNVRQMIIQGSAAVLVEPAPLAFIQLQELYMYREDVHCFNLAVSDYNGKATFFDSGVHLGKNDSSLLSSLHETEIKKWEKSTSFKEIQVNVVDFNILLEMSPYKKFQLISIDVEGSDVVCLKQMDLTALGCELLCIEWNSIESNRKVITEYANRHGLNLIHTNLENLIFAK